jgi:sugar lactone lactonase YvrE
VSKPLFCFASKPPRSKWLEAVMTKDSAGTRARSRVSPVARAAALAAVATVAALVPAAAASGQSRPGLGSAGAALVAGDISTVAGGKAPGPAPATSVSFSPCGVSFAGGSVYVGASQTVRQVSQAGTLTTPAGTGSSGPLGDGGLATRASLEGACSTAVDGSGNLVVADSGKVRVVAGTTGTFYGQAMHKGDIYTIPGTSAGGIALDAVGNVLMAGGSLVQVLAVTTGTFYGQAMTAGNVYTVAGGGHNGLGDGGPATFAEVSPDGVTVDATGNLVIADRGNGRIRVVAVKAGTFYGQKMTAGDIYTVAGGGTSGLGDGGPATKAELSADGVAVDTAGNLVIADGSNGRVRVVAVKAGTFYGQKMTAGDIYTVAGGGTRLGDGGPATSAEVGPVGVALDTNGNLVIADSGNNRVRVVAAQAGTFYGMAMKAGHIYTIAGNGLTAYSGDGGPATEAQLNNPGSVAVDAAGNLVIADWNNDRIRVAAAKTGTFYGMAMTAGNIYTVAGDGKREFIPQFLQSGIPATKAAVGPGGVTLDRAGNLVIADARGIRVVAVKTATFYHRAMTAGDIYTVAGNGGIGFSGDGGPATAAEFNGPRSVAVDAAGNLVTADTQNDRIRVVAAKTGMFYGVPMTAGDVYTVAGAGSGGDGGPAITAQLSQPAGVALDAAGNVVIADTSDRRIRVIAVSTGTFYGRAMTADDIYTVAGGGTSDPGDGGPATAAQLTTPVTVAVDGHGNLVLTDLGFSVENPRVRVVAEATGTFYGQAMTAGDIYTVAGGNPAGFSGDGGPATGAELNSPESVAVVAAGGLLIADSGNNRIREVAG